MQFESPRGSYTDSNYNDKREKITNLVFSIKEAMCVPVSIKLTTLKNKDESNRTSARYFFYI